MRPSGYSGADDAVSPVIGVMLMIVVTIIIAAVVSAFAGGFSSSEKKAPTAVLSCTVLHGTGSGDYPNGGLLFTQDSGDAVFLNSTYMVLANGQESRRFANLVPVTLNNGNATWIIRSGGQFALAADNDGSSVTNGYLGWTGPEFTFTTTEISTYKLVDRETGQSIAQGTIDI